MEKFIHVDCCNSTQELLKEQLAVNPNDELTVSCELQLQGRGRGINTWEDSNGTICFSMNIAPHSKTSFTALEMSLLVSRFFETKGRFISLKWPNDLQNEMGKKCGGILVQNAGINYLAGIGINLFHEKTEFGGVYETNFEIEKKSWAQDIGQFIRIHRYEETSEIIADWTKKCVHLNQQVKIIENEQVTTGLFLGLGEYGEALIMNESGIHHLYNGTLRLV